MTREPEVTVVHAGEVPLRVELLVSGVRITGALPAGSKLPHRVRSGSCGGIDLILPDGTYVNAPVNEHFVEHSRFRLVFDEGEQASVIDDETGVSTSVVLPAAPAYYQDTRCSSGRKMVQVGQICSDRLGIGLTNRCTFWSHRSERCKFCSIGLNVDTGAEVRNKELDEMVELVDVAVDDKVQPARHVLLGGGTPPGSDAGARAIALAAARMKERHPDVPIYAMIVPPEDRRWIPRLRDAGVDELGMNVELFGPSGEYYLPGKYHRIGLSGYVSALAMAVENFGPVHTRSIVLAGLEPVADTLKGIDLLASLGVMPILTPFRPLVGTELEFHPKESAAALWRLTKEAADVALGYDIPLGPTCIPCQSNTLTALPDRRYRFY